MERYIDLPMPTIYSNQSREAVSLSVGRNDGTVAVNFADAMTIQPAGSYSFLYEKAGTYVYCSASPLGADIVRD